MEDTLHLIDTHAHLHMGQFDEDRTAAIERAAAVGVARIIEIGYDLPSSRAAIALAEAHPQVFAVVGVQPNHLAELPAGWLEEVRALAAHPRVVAIGEIGLDFYWKKAPLEEQERAFRAQLALARELGLPVVIHSREAQADTLRILSDAARGQPGVMHSFLGDWAFAQGCLEVGFLLSFSGPVTFAKLSELHAAARLAPREMILAETDSPYLTPHPHRGRRNEPAYVAHVVRRLAELRGETPTAMAAQIWANAERAFPRLTNCG
jgi:TatD DNase family protein